MFCKVVHLRIISEVVQGSENWISEDAHNRRLVASQFVVVRVDIDADKCVYCDRYANAQESKWPMGKCQYEDPQSDKK